MSERNDSQNNDSLKPPKGMPMDFIFEKKRYKWHSYLPEAKKRQMMDLFLNWKDHVQPIREELRRLENQFLFKIKGMIIMMWDERIGPLRLGSYPKKLKLNDTTLIQVFANHQMTHPPGIISMQVGEDFVISYESDREHEIYIIVISENIDEPYVLENGIMKISELLKMKKDRKPFKMFEVEKFFDML